MNSTKAGEGLGPIDEEQATSLLLLLEVALQLWQPSPQVPFPTGAAVLAAGGLVNHSYDDDHEHDEHLKEDDEAHFDDKDDDELFHDANEGENEDESRAERR